MSHQQSSTFPLLAHHWFCRSIANQEEVDFTDRGNQNTMSIPRQSKKVSANLVPILDQSLTQASIRPKSTNTEPISVTNISSFDISPDIMPIHLVHHVHHVSNANPSSIHANHLHISIRLLGPSWSSSYRSSALPLHLNSTNSTGNNWCSIGICLANQ